jgi:hypothetical protein
MYCNWAQFPCIAAGATGHGEWHRKNHMEYPMSYWEPITYKDLILLTEWMAQHGYSAAQLAEAVSEPANYAEELRALVRRNAEKAAAQQAHDKAIQQAAAAEFMATRAAKHREDAA